MIFLDFARSGLDAFGWFLFLGFGKTKWEERDLILVMK